MANLRCPHCGAEMSSERTWDQVAVSTLIAAPAVPDMATQVRCSSCGRVSAASELRVIIGDRFIPKNALRWFLIAAVALPLQAWLLLR
jgi:hypothetical protein